MTLANGSWRRWILLSASGIVSFGLSLYGLFACMMFDYRLLPDLSLGICMLLPFPLFLVSMKSVKWSALLLVLLTCSLWAVQAFLGGPNRSLNPFDGLSPYYFCPAALMLAVLFVNSDSRSLFHSS
jgi:hypothetical protein